MIRYFVGNIFESQAMALVNTVNLVGVMGKGVALQFKNKYPNNFKEYVKACKSGDIAIGKLFVFREFNAFEDRYIINFPTKINWRNPSEYSYIEQGLDDLVRVIDLYSLKSVAIPPLGAGNGGLNWLKVKQLIETKLSNVNADIMVYEPNAVIVDQMKQERVKLTPARALLLYVLFDLVRHGEFVSEFSSEKVCYFLQRFGAEKYFGLEFKKCYYGPYSGKVKRVLNAMNGSYIMGYNGMDKKPFDTLSLLPDSYVDVETILLSDDELMRIAEKTMNFLDGFYSDFALELLSSVDYLLSENPNLSLNEVSEQLRDWNPRKSQLFANDRYIKIAYEHIKKNCCFNS